MCFCLYMHTRFCVSVHVSTSVSAHATCESAQCACLDGRGGSEGGFVYFVSICRQRREEVVDAGLIPALQSELHGQPSLVHCPPPCTYYSTGFSVIYLPPTPYPPNACTHTHTSLSALLGLAGRRIIFQHLCSSVPVCLLPEASGTPGPELHLLLSSLLSSFFSPLPCLAVMSPVSFQVYSYE